MNLNTVPFFRGIMILSAISLSIMVQAQETNIDDTSKYDPYRIMQGHRVAKSKFGELNIRPYTYVRYLNQKLVDETYTDGFGKMQTVDTRQNHYSTKKRDGV